jgi:hypothetical protein
LISLYQGNTIYFHVNGNYQDCPLLYIYACVWMFLSLLCALQLMAISPARNWPPPIEDWKPRPTRPVTVECRWHNGTMADRWKWNDPHLICAHPYTCVLFPYQQCGSLSSSWPYAKQPRVFGIFRVSCYVMTESKIICSICVISSIYQTISTPSVT